jgi:predicted lactoylglutathione lyase
MHPTRLGLAAPRSPYGAGSRVRRKKFPASPVGCDGVGPSLGKDWPKHGGFHDPQFTGDEAACLVISDTAYVMLLPHARFAQFTTKEIADTSRATSGLISLWRDSRAEVDAELDAAKKAGAMEAGQPEDLGFMYMRGYHDLDGHGWGINWMDPTAKMPA